MPTIAAIHARNLRHLERVQVDLAGSKHLVILGSSGSGKTTLIEAIVDEVEAALDGSPHPAEGIDELTRDGDKRIKLAHVGRPLRLDWGGKPLIEPFERGEMVLASCPAPRPTSFSDVREPVQHAPARPRQRVGQHLPALLLLHDTEQRLAVNTGDPKAARRHELWLARAQEGLRAVLSQPTLRITNDRSGLHLDLADGRRWELLHLSSGLASAVAIWAELWARVSAARARHDDDEAFEPDGVAVVDALESDLDVRLQARLLPALARLFPRVQWIVATHSPLAAASLANAKILDLDRNEVRSSEEVQREGADGLLVRMIGTTAKGSSLPPPAEPTNVAPAPKMRSARPIKAVSPSSIPPPRVVPPPPALPTFTQPVSEPLTFSESITGDDLVSVANEVTPTFTKPAPRSEAPPPRKPASIAPPPAVLPPKRPSATPAPQDRAKRKTLNGPGPWSDD